MRGFAPVMPAGLFLLCFSAGCWGETPPPASPSADAPVDKPGGVPAWVPEATPEQAALLSPVQRAIKSPAPRVFPDLARFGYAPNRPLADPADAIKFTRMVTKLLSDSPRFYSLEELPPGAANPVTQYG